MDSGGGSDSGTRALLIAWVVASEPAVGSIAIALDVSWVPSEDGAVGVHATAARRSEVQAAVRAIVAVRVRRETDISPTSWPE